VLTSVFLHPTVEHLVMNLAGIAVLGWAIERSFGRGCWTALTFAAVLVCGASELAIRGQLGVGASGVLYSFFGFTLFATVRRRLIPRWLLVLVAIWLLYGLLLDVASVLDHHWSGRPHDPRGTHAHLTGFGLGLMWALAFVISWKPRRTRTALACIIAAACVPLNGSPWLSDWLMTRGYREYRKGNLQVAIAWYSRAISHRDQPVAAYLGRGEVLLFDAKFDEALADFTAALKLDAKIPNARSLRAAAFELRSDLDSAWNESNAGLQNGEYTGYAYAMRGTIALARADYDAAAKDFESAIDREPGNAYHWVNRASVRFEQSRHDEALADTEHALWLDPQDATGLFARGLVLHDLSHGDRARADMERAYQLTQRELILRPRDVWTVCQLANLQLALFDIDPSPERLLEARLHADQALHLAPAFWEAWRMRGTAEFYQKEFALAEQHLSRALELNSHDVWAACHLGLTYHELGRPDDALRSLDKAISLNPQFGYAYRSRGLVRNALNDHPTAIRDLTRAVALNPRFAEAYHLRGQARLADGDAEGGRKDMRRAAELNSKYAGEDQSGQ
jgi:tetratricopeptide (TPR) repeat protein